jgi:hypothetical protein
MERKFGDTASPLIFSGCVTPAISLPRPSARGYISENVRLWLRQSRKFRYDTLTVPTMGVVLVQDD